MNKEQCSAIRDQLEEIEAARNALDLIKGDLEALFGDRSDVWQESEKGEAMANVIETLDSFISAIEVDALEVEELLDV